MPTVIARCRAWPATRAGSWARTWRWRRWRSRSPRRWPARSACGRTAAPPRPGHGRHDRPGGVDTCVGDQQCLAAEPVRGRAGQDRPGCAAGRGAGHQVFVGWTVQSVRDEGQRGADVGGVVAVQGRPTVASCVRCQLRRDGGCSSSLVRTSPVTAGRAMLVRCGARDPGRLLCDLNITAFLRFARRCPARRRGCSVWSLAGWLQAAAGRAVVVSASGRPLRLVRWPRAV